MQSYNHPPPSIQMAPGTSVWGPYSADDLDHP